MQEKIETSVKPLILRSLVNMEKVINDEENRPSRIVFPQTSEHKNSSDGPRYSEQELKNIFLHEIEQSDLYYSVETPSYFKYRFSDKVQNVQIPKVTYTPKAKGEPVYQASMIDVSVWSSVDTKSSSVDTKSNKVTFNNLISHVEFKYDSRGQFPVQKDFLKLIFENQGRKNYFVHYFSSSTDETKETALEHYIDSVKSICESIEDNVKKGLKDVIDLDKSKIPTDIDGRLNDISVLVLFHCEENGKIKSSILDVTLKTLCGCDAKNDEEIEKILKNAKSIEEVEEELKKDNNNERK